MKAKKALMFITALIPLAILFPTSHLTAAPLNTLSLTLNFPLMMNNYIGPPPLSTSYYIDGDATNNFNLGCEKGTNDSNTTETRDSILILDYGGIKIQNGVYGATYFILGGFISVDEIAVATEDFALGYIYCMHRGAYPNYSSKLKIVIGTNSSTTGGWITPDHAVAWANMIHNVNEYLSNNGISTQVTAEGGNDIELDWNPPSVVEPWINSFILASDSTVKHYNFGNALGCQVSSDNCFNPWTKHDMWSISRGDSGKIFPFPEIYNIYNAQQWYAVGKYSHDHEAGQVTFPAVLSQFQACQQRSCPNSTKTNPDRAWLELLAQLAADPDTSQLNIQWLSDLKHYPQ